MLTELRVTNLGVIQDVTMVVGTGMTALTGETGAGKTLLVDAISLLLGASTDADLVRPGAAEALVEGRFTDPAGEERILTRVVPATGHSRAYIDGRMASAANLGDVAGQLVDLHGQNGRQALLGPAAQRALLDQFASIPTDEVTAARRALKELEASRAAFGGDERARAREMDLLRYQIDELDKAGLESAEEDERLSDEEDTLAAASSLREAAAHVHAELTAEDGVTERVGSLLHLVAAGKALSTVHDRLAAVALELSDLAQETRLAVDSLEDDPERLEWIGARRQLLRDLRRKYGESLEDVIAFRDLSRQRLEELESHDQRAACLDREIEVAQADLAEKERELLSRRQAAAPALSAAVETRLRELAMPRARFVIEVGDQPPGDSVTWMLGANPGEPVLPLSKVASGGELARTMLAARLAVAAGLTAASETISCDSPVGPGSTVPSAGTLVFDEVDAGIGGEAAVAVGRALAALSSDYQVLVVTHLPQVGSFADSHLVVEKREEGDRTVASVKSVDGADRVVELSRMLSGSPNSETARRHAEELLLNRPEENPSTRRRTRLR
ncbi:MAG TPA: DNA repair protein RecN [Acidimicrobiales bacterium]|nr:DNA repair protein RecN [Acidimicrobiales bacterium]